MFDIKRERCDLIAQMIEFTRGYKSSDGKIHVTIEEAKIAELIPIIQTAGSGPSGLSADAVANSIVYDQQKVIDILTTTDTSRPKARRVNGGAKKRQPKIVTEKAA